MKPRKPSLRLIPDSDVREDLTEVVRHAEEEARMILPGIQALFGFQLIVVFNPGFAASLSRGEQMAHLGAIGAIIAAIVLMIAPAAYHRQAEPGGVSARFVSLANRFLCAGLAFLQLGVTLDFYLIARVILEDSAWAMSGAGAVFAITTFWWFIFPRTA